MLGRGLGRPLGAARGARTCERPGLQLRCARTVVSRVRNLQQTGQGNARTSPGLRNVRGAARGGLQRLRGGRT